MTDDLAAQAAALGLQIDFIDGYGLPHRTSPEALTEVLQALPVSPQKQFLRDVPVVKRGEIADIELKRGAGAIDWKVCAADLVLLSGHAADGRIVLPGSIATGVYELQLQAADGTVETSPIMVAPPRANSGNFDRTWILAVQLYSVRSTRNSGIGDFGDLNAVIDFVARAGAHGVGLNPLHALFDDRPRDCSPYSPNSRQFLNPLYIDVRKLGVALTSTDLAEAERLRDLEFVDYDAVSTLKQSILRRAFDMAGDHVADPDYVAFCAERAPGLTRFAAFEALRHARREAWWDWPDHRTPDDADLTELATGPLSADIAFVKYVQWIADRQLRDCRDHAARLGLSVGLYLDIAVGVQSDGFDAWNDQVAISRALGVGAPPDPLNAAGQSWGLAGYNASGLEAQNFTPYRDMLRASMRYAGAVRLDHILGLKRLYLIPQGFPPNEGVYAPMPFEAMLALTALESEASGCVVIGEDLGTVPEGFREAMNGWGLWSYRVMMFEQDYHSRVFFPPQAYPADALVTFNTHDLATFEGWRTLSDLRQKRAIGLDPGESDDARHHAIHLLREALDHQGIHGDSVYDVVAFMSRTPSRLLAVAIEDLLAVVEQPNIPGTIDEHPNWRRKLPISLDAFESTISLHRLRDALQDRIPPGFADSSG